MRIGIFTESFLPQVNGVVVSICNSATLLSKKHDVDVFTVGDGPSDGFPFKVTRFKGVRLPTYPEYRFFFPDFCIRKRLSQRRFDIVHVRSSVAFSLVALRAARVMKAPLVGTFDTPITDYIHYVPILGKIGPLKKTLSFFAMKYIVWFYNRCDVVIAPSRTYATWLKRTGCKGKVVVLSNGVDTKRFNPKNADQNLRRKLCSGDEFLILHVGRITNEKSVDVLLKTAKELTARNVRFKLVVVGRGPAMPQLQMMSKSLDVEKNVVFVGFVPDSELPKYYASADAFVTASTVETEGIVLLEAMASGLPVVGAAAGAIPEEIIDGENGFLFKPGDAKDLANKIMKLFDKKTSKRISDNTLRTSKSHSIVNTVEKLELLYKSLIAQ